VANLQLKNERPSYLTAARNDARAEMRSGLRDALLAGLLAFVLPAAAAVVVYYSAARSRENDVLRQLQTQAEYLASSLNAGNHANLTGDGSRNSAAYNDLLNSLQRAKELSPDWERLVTGRSTEGQIAFLIVAENARDVPRGTPDVDGVRSLLEEPADNHSREESGGFLSAASAFLQKDGPLRVIAPIGNLQAGVRDFLYLEASRKPLEQELALARDARDMCLIAAALLGLATTVIVLVWRYRTALRHAIAVNKTLESESLFRSTYEMSPVGMYLSATNGRIIRTNRAFCRFLDYSESELLKLLPSEYARDAGQTGAESPTAYQPALQQMERCYVRRDGRQVWGLVSTAIVRDAHNEISHYLVQVVDITERKILAEARRLSEERLGLAADTGRVGIWDYDMTNGEVVWNSVMHDIHQTDRETFSATFDSQLGFIFEEDRQPFADEFTKCLRDRQPFVREYRIVSQEGNLRHIKTRALILRDSTGKAIRAVGTAIDISDEKAEAAELIRTREAALAADKAKSEFLAMMSHEIRTPLNGVLGFTSMLKVTPLDDQQLSYIETMESSGERLLSLVNDILDLSKIEAREIHVEPTTFEIEPFLREIHRQIYAQAQEKDIQYELIIKSSVPPAIATDRHRLGQILTNLLANAVKFTDAGRVTLRVEATPGEPDHEWRFIVQDTGCGIPAGSMSHLFQAFYQVDSSNTRRYGGTGLGLAISQRVAKLINGEISASSEPGRGSEFTLVLRAPAGTLPTSPPQPPAANVGENVARLRGKRILAVEDNALNRKLCGLQLKRLGCVVEFAETGREALDKVRHQQFAAVLMDVQLPDLDGCDTTRQIRLEENADTHLPIIALTANAMPEDRRRCLDSGMDDFLSKPLQHDVLAAALARWV